MGHGSRMVAGGVGGEVQGPPTDLVTHVGVREARQRLEPPLPLPTLQPGSRPPRPGYLNFLSLAGPVVWGFVWSLVQGPSFLICTG